MDGKEIALARFGDGVEMPRPAIKGFDNGLPRLNQDLYPAAMRARDTQHADFFVNISAHGRAFAMTIEVAGVTGRVVKRFRAEQTEAEFLAGLPVDASPIATLVVKFAVLDVLIAHKREYFRAAAPIAANYGPKRKRSHRRIKIR